MGGMLLLMFNSGSPQKMYCRLTLGLYTERIDLRFEPFFVKETRHVIE
jgi:hypothetical protein